MDVGYLRLRFEYFPNGFAYRLDQVRPRYNSTSSIEWPLHFFQKTTLLRENLKIPLKKGKDSEKPTGIRL